MTEKNKPEQVSKRMMEELDAVVKAQINPIHLGKIINGYSTGLKTDKINKWYYNESSGSAKNDQMKLIKHIWLHEPQFEEEKPKKYVIKYKELDYDDDPCFVAFDDTYSLKKVGYTTEVSSAAVFDTKEEAEKWTNPLTEVVEVEEDESN